MKGEREGKLYGNKSLGNPLVRHPSNDGRRSYGSRGSAGSKTPVHDTKKDHLLKNSKKKKMK